MGLGFVFEKIWPKQRNNKFGPKSVWPKLGQNIKTLKQATIGQSRFWPKSVKNITGQRAGKVGLAKSAMTLSTSPTPATRFELLDLDPHGLTSSLHVGMRGSSSDESSMRGFQTCQHSLSLLFHASTCACPWWAWIRRFPDPNPKVPISGISCHCYRCGRLWPNRAQIGVFFLKK